MPDTVEALRLGELDCVLASPAGGLIDRLLVLCHGYGAPGDDLIPLARELDSSRSAVLFPEAPLALDGVGVAGGRAWWHLNLSRLQNGTPLDAQTLAAEEPPGSSAAASALYEAVTECVGQLGLDHSQVILGGFSQGAMVAADVACRFGHRWAGLCLFSCGPQRLEAWAAGAAAMAGRPVLQTHGRADPILPFHGAELVRDALESAGLDVDFRPFDGPHTIPAEAMARLSDLLDSAIPSGVGGEPD